MIPERLDSVGDITWGEAGADHMARYHFASSFVRGKRVLDVGTGMGYGAALLKIAGASSVAAFDIDEATVKAARELFGHSGIDFTTANSETFDETFHDIDVIVSFENIEHISSPVRFVHAARKALAPGGLLICSTPARERDPEFINGKPKNPYHVNEWYEQEFRDLLGAAFGDIETYSQMESFSFLQRRQAVETLQRILAHPLRGSILHNSLRLVSRASRAFGVKAISSTLKLGGDISGLACPSPADFPVVHSAVRSLFGRLFVHCLVCRP